MNRSRQSSTDSFRSANSHQSAYISARPRFSPEEQEALLKESQDHKSSANALYARSAFNEAIGQYDKALASCPNYLDYEIAVLKSNIAACYIKLSEWKNAVDASSKAIDCLNRIIPVKKESNETQNDAAGRKIVQDASQDSNSQVFKMASDSKATVVELSDDEDESTALAALQLSDEKRQQVRSLRAKSLMRRARGNMEIGGWAPFAAAEQDYKEVLELNVVPKADERFIRQQLVALPAKTNAAKEKEMAEMMGKLKELGNGILKPFGLSTDMFKFQQDPATGGYNMSFDGKNA